VTDTPAPGSQPGEPAGDRPPTQDPRPAELRRATSLLLVNTGDGKGKSSAAFGVMVRAVARGWKVAVVQFVKSGDWSVGEEAIGRQLGVTWVHAGDGFTWDSENLEHDRAIARAGWAAAARIIRDGAHQLVILDELTYLMNWAWVEADDVLATLTGRPEHVNVVVTGRDASPALVAIADTVTEMRKVKHPFDRGIAAKRGIDY
jgi:cob(I)alamin adenosyltransferase